MGYEKSNISITVKAIKHTVFKVMFIINPDYVDVVTSLY